MKQGILIVAFLLSMSFSLLAQQWGGSSTTTGLITRDGDIRLHDNQSWRVSLGPAWGDINIGYGTGYLGFNLARNNHSDGNWTFFNDGVNNGATVIYGNIFGDLLFSNKLSTGNINGTITDNDIKNSIKMKIQNDGKIIIGNPASITSPGSYKLYVETGILTEKVRVAIKTSADWADHVFSPNYRLMPLAEVSAYINKNKHLPGVPSAQELIKEGGIDVNQMFAKQMEKIEEQMLYLIELNKEIQQLKLENELLKKQVQNSKVNLQK